MYSFLKNYRAVFSSQWWRHERISRFQERKLVRLVQHAYATVPYYKSLFDGTGVSPSTIKTLDDLQRLPVTTKQTLSQIDPEERISSRFKGRGLEHDSSSGSSGMPFSVYLDRHYVLNRNMRFLRGLIATGYRPGDRLLLITDRHGGTSKPWMRWVKVSPEESPSHLLERLIEVRPAVLYGSGTPLRQLAEKILETGYRVNWLKSVVWTAETLDEKTRRLLEQAFGARIYDFYGLTEMGLVAWECQAHAGYHVSDDSILVELLPLTGSGGTPKMAMTNLDLYSMPLIRYDSGDLAIAQSIAPCSCGRGLSRLERVEGRVVDTIKLRSGTTISPYTFICQLETLEGLRRFQILQDSYDHITVSIQSEDCDRARLDQEVRRIIQGIAGNQLNVTFNYPETLHSEENGKFRAVQSLVEKSA